MNTKLWMPTLTSSILIIVSPNAKADQKREKDIRRIWRASR